MIHFMNALRSQDFLLHRLTSFHPSLAGSTRPATGSVYCRPYAICVPQVKSCPCFPLPPCINKAAFSLIFRHTCVFQMQRTRHRAQPLRDLFLQTRLPMSMSVGRHTGKEREGREGEERRERKGEIRKEKERSGGREGGIYGKKREET